MNLINYFKSKKSAYESGRKFERKKATEKIKSITKEHSRQMKSMRKSNRSVQAEMKSELLQSKAELESIGKSRAKAVEQVRHKIKILNELIGEAHEILSRNKSRMVDWKRKFGANIDDEHSVDIILSRLNQIESKDRGGLDA